MNTNRAVSQLGVGVERVVSIDTGPHRARVRQRRDELIAAHLSLVEGIARAVARSLPPCFDLDDLVQVGRIALLQSATTYRPDAHGGAPFDAYARQRIRGAILDSVRRNKWVENTRASIDEIEIKHGARKEITCEVADAVSRAAVQPDQEDQVDAQRVSERLQEAISWLPADQQRVLRAYYGAKEPSLAAVAKRLGRSKATVLQLHAAGVEGLRARFRLAA